eukprot:5196468-Pyramimonas_sp.AAC.1
MKRARGVPARIAGADPAFEAPRLREVDAVSENFDEARLPPVAAAVPSRSVYAFKEGGAKTRL